MHQTDADGNTTSYGYTVENMVSRVTYADGDTLHYAYDKAGNLVRETNADGGITRYTYDLLGQLTGIKAADGTITEYEYNADGEVVSELVRNIAYSGENDGENHYSNLVNTSSKPLVATAIRYPEDAFDSTKGRSATRPPVNKPTPPKPNAQANDYAKARRQATTPTQEEYQQLLRLGYNGSYGQYANDKQRSNFPSPAEYTYNKQQGRPNYQNYGPVEVAKYQSGETSYRVSHVAASGTPKVESVVTGQKYGCSNFDYYAEKYFSDGNIYGTIVGGSSVISSSLFKWLTKSVKNAIRPANIGAGIFSKQIANEINSLTRIGSKFSKALNFLSVGSIIIDVGIGIYNNKQNRESAEHIVADAITDAAITGGNVLLSIGASAAVGALFGGPIGAVAALVTSVIYSVVSDVITIDGETLRDKAKDYVRQIIDGA